MVTDNDAWSMRALIAILGTTLAALIAAQTYLATNGRSLPESMVGLAPFIAGGLVNAVTVRIRSAPRAVGPVNPSAPPDAVQVQVTTAPAA